MSSIINQHPNLQSLGFDSKINEINSNWINSSNWGIFGSRRRVKVIFNEKGELSDIHLIAQTAIGRFIRFLGKPFARGKDFGKSYEKLPVHHRTFEIWKNACTHLGKKSCADILNEKMHPVMTKTPHEIQKALNESTIISLRDYLDKLRILKFMGQDFAKYLEHFYSSTEREWELFVQEKLDITNKHINITSLVTEVYRKQNEIVEKCRNIALNEIENHLNARLKEDSLHSKLLKMPIQSPVFDTWLNSNQKLWSDLQKNIQTASSIEKLDSEMDNILEAKIVEEATIQLLIENGIDGCLEAAQVKSIELLIKLDPHNTTFQGFHSPKALTAEFLFEQIKFYNDKNVKERLSDWKLDILEDLNANIKCIEHLENAIKIEKEKEKTLLVNKLKSTQMELKDKIPTFKEELTPLIVKSNPQTENALINFLDLLNEVNLINSLNVEEIDWSKIPESNIIEWINKTQETLQRIQQSIQKTLQTARDSQVLFLPLLQKYNLKSLSELLQNKSFPADPFKKDLLESFILNLEQIRLNTLVNLDTLDSSEFDSPASIIEEITHIDEILQATLTKFIEGFSVDSSLTTCLKEIINKILKLDLLNESHEFEKLSILNLFQILAMFNDNENEKGNIEGQKKDNKQIKTNLKIFTQCLYLFANAAIKTILNRQKIMLFTTDELIKQHPNASELREKVLNPLMRIPMVPNIEQLPLKHLLSYIQSNQQKLENANSVIHGLAK